MNKNTQSIARIIKRNKSLGWLTKNQAIKDVKKWLRYFTKHFTSFDEQAFIMACGFRGEI